jgi:hypothetical protein
MKRSLLALVPVISLATVIGGCNGKKGEPVAVKSYADYTDEILKFSVRYPSDWAKGIQPGTQAVFYSTQAVAESFSKFEPTGDGAKIDIHAMVGGQEAMDKSVAELKETFTDPSVIKSTEQTTLNGNPATKISYGFDVKDTKFTAERWYVVKDGAVTYLETATFGDYAAYAAVFDSARASFKPAMVAARPTAPTDASSGAVRDSQVVEIPAPEMKSYSSPHFTIGYPGNFSPTTRGGKKLASVAFAGTRNDSYFQVDVDKAPDGTTLDAIADASKKAFGGRPGSKTTVGGQPAYVFSYSGAKDVTSRVYITMAGGKVYQITVNWYTPQAANYQPAFEKAIASFKAK